MNVIYHFYCISRQNQSFLRILLNQLKRTTQAYIYGIRSLLLRNFSQLFEICNKIYLQMKPYISSYQHVFIEDRSCVTNVICLFQHVCETLNRWGQVNVICMDLRRPLINNVLHMTVLVRRNLQLPLVCHRCPILQLAFINY